MQFERRLSDWLDAFMDCHENSEPPRQFRLWTGIGVIAAALQRKCYMEWDKDVYANMYIGLIGPSGTKKGTAMGPGAELLNAIGLPIAAEAITPEQLIRRMSEINNTEHDTETGEMIMHSSFTIFSEEFTVFLGYKNDKLMANLCRLYDCPIRFIYDTKTQGTDEIIGAWLNIIGATTPSTLRESLPISAIGGGLTSRMILVYGEQRDKKVTLPIRSKEERDLFEILKIDLEKIFLMKGRFRFTEGFLEEYAKWYNNDEKPEHLSEYFGGYISRRSTHIRKLCMVLSASRTDNMVITADDFIRSKEILEATEILMNKVFAGVGHADTAELMPRIMRFLAERSETSYQDLMRQFYQDADRITMDRIIQTLDSMGFIDIDRSAGVIKYTGPEDVHDVLKGKRE